jgi:hypothetical protein
MVRGPAFETLSDIVAKCESHGGTVQSVEASTVDTAVQVELVVDHRIEAGGADTFTPEAASLTDSGDLRVRFRAPSLESLLPTATPITAERTTAVAVTDTGALRCTHEFTLGATEPEPESSATHEEPAPSTAPKDPLADDGPTTVADELAAVRDESIPAYEDTAYLEALYESCETFGEMSEHIEMDVVAETVRRYMVDAGIHTPDSYETTMSDNEETPDGTEPLDTSPETPTEEQLVADGLGLPDGLQVTDLVDAVADATSVCEVTRSLGLDQTRTRELLAQFDLLGGVVHRVADDHRGLTREEVLDHIRRQGTPERI